MDEPAHTPEHPSRPDPPTGSGPGDPALPDVTSSFDGELDGELDGALDGGPDSETDRHVRALLAAQPEPGPMPAEVSDRISAALLEAARLRVDPGPLSRTDAATDTPAAHLTAGGALLTLPSRLDRPNRPKPAYLVAAVAAAALVVAGGASALHVTKRPNGAAAIGDAYSSRTSATTPATAPTPSTQPPTSDGLHVQLSRTAYGAGTLAAQARALLDHPGPSVRDLAAESPAIGPIATPIGLESCLEALGALDATHPTLDAVSVDLATYDGKPAAVLVVTRAGASTAWAVARSCTTGSPGVLKGATPVP